MISAMATGYLEAANAVGKGGEVRIRINTQKEARCKKYWDLSEEGSLPVCST